MKKLAIGLLLAAACQAQAAADFSGTWLLAGGGGDGSAIFNSNPESQWSAEKLPFTPQGRAAFDANRPGKGPRLRNIPLERNDPLVKGNPPGLYRSLVHSNLFQFLQAPGRIVQIFSWGRVWRSIDTDGRPVPREVGAGPFWYGHSVGRWEGDALVVNTQALDSRAWFDEWGTPISDDARIEERWQRIAPDTLRLQITVTDPVMYSKPWTSMPLNMKLQKPSAVPVEVIHSPMDEGAFESIITGPASGPQP